MPPKQRFDEKVQELKSCNNCSLEKATDDAIKHFKENADKADEILNYIHALELQRLQK
jgi:hypothetical protein